MMLIFFISLLVSDFRKSVWSVPSISVAVLVQTNTQRKMSTAKRQNIASLVAVFECVDSFMRLFAKISI